jgi:hypothetical protein
MAVTNPPGFQQNAGATHTAEILRNAFNAGMAGARSAASLTPRPGVHPSLGQQLVVTQQSSPTMGVTVGTGQVFVPGTEGSAQGIYSCQAPTTTNLTITAANASLARRDLIMAQVRDTAYSGATNDWQLVVVTGTAASSPVDPTWPSNAIPIARVNVAANATSIVNANITDLRTYIGQGVIPIDIVANLPTVAFEGLLAYVQANDSIYYYNGTAWIQLSGSTNTTTVGSIGTVASSFTVADIRAATTMGGKLVELDFSLTLVTAIPSSATAGNIADLLCFTVTNAAYRPDHMVEFSFDNGSVGGMGVIDTDGTVTLRITTYFSTSGNAVAAGTTIKFNSIFIKN